MQGITDVSLCHKVVLKNLMFKKEFKNLPSFLSPKSSLWKFGGASVFINYQLYKRSNSFSFSSSSLYRCSVKMKVLLFAALLIAYANAFCMHQYGGIGEYHRACSDSAGN